MLFRQRMAIVTFSSLYCQVSRMVLQYAKRVMDSQPNVRDYRVVVFKIFLAFWFLVVIVGIHASL